MAHVHVEAKRDFLESLTVATPLMAVAELIWNGFDAGANKVEVFLDRNALDGLDAIRVHDTGVGIDHPNVEKYFGNLGESWKKYTSRKDGRVLHGKNGKGRFKAFTLGEKVEWYTCYNDNGKTYSCRISGHYSTLEDFDVADPELADGARVGTEVSIFNIKHNFTSLQDDSTADQLARIFALYLTEYPHLRLVYDGNRIDPCSAQINHSEYQLPEIDLGDGKNVAAIVSIIEWNYAAGRSLHLCDQGGISLHEIQVGQQVRAPDYNFTIYVKSAHLLELDKTNRLILDDLDPDVKAIVSAAKEKAKDHFRKLIAEEQGKIVERWKAEDIYPYVDKETNDPVERVERQVFDIIAANVSSHLSHFEDSDTKSKKFTFRLLAQAIKQNPESVQEIIGEVLGLKKEEQDDLVRLLRKTSLSSIISSAKIVANRNDFLDGLEHLLFDPKNKKALLERDQLHKILENEAWLFHEDFYLAGSELRLEEVLEKHIRLLGKRYDDTDLVDVGDGKRGRIDLMLNKAIQPRTGEFDYLIVELKRPSQKINADVLTQIEKYAFAVANDERFRGVTARWKFLAISTDLDSFAEKKANQRERPKGLIYDDADNNITVWVRPWAEVIGDARARLRFYSDQLAYQADHNSAIEYLKSAHAKFIPEIKEKDASEEGEQNA